jgi:hypothetical protein
MLKMPAVQSVLIGTASKVAPLIATPVVASVVDSSRRIRSRRFRDRARRSRAATASALVSDRLTISELSAIECSILDNCKVALAAELLSFDTQRADEFDLGGASAYFAGTGSQAFVASSAPRADPASLLPIPSTKCKAAGIALSRL